MIIGIDASRANREQKNGVENYAFFLIEEMKKIFNFQFSNFQNTKVILYSDWPLKGVLAKLPPNWESKVLRWPPKRLWTQARLSWEMLSNPPDVLFIPAHVFPSIHPKKTVMMVHDVAAARFPESYSWFERWYSIFSGKRALQNLWKVIVPSQFTKNELQKLEKLKEAKKLEEKVSVVHHGYDTRYKKLKEMKEIETIQKILDKYSVTKPFIMSVGRLEEKKNTARLVEAFNTVKIKQNLPIFQFSNLQLLLAGLPGHGYEKVKEAINQSPYKNDIIAPGWVDADDLPYLMNAAKAFVFPSLYEGFGLPVLEAFACGTPVVAGKGSSLEEVAGDAAVFVDPLNSDDIAQGVLKFLADPVLREEKIRKGLDRVREFSWERCARKTMKILMEN